MSAEGVCLILGAGSGIGAHVATRFAREGYHVALCRRTDQAGLQRSVDIIKEAGGSASGMLLDATAPDAIEEFVIQVENTHGPITTAVFNLGAQSGDRGLAETSLKQFELAWRMTSLALFRLAKVLMPLMVERGSGTLLVTSATAAARGNAGQHAHAAAIGGRRLLCQSLNAEFGPRGIHVAHIIVDGAVNSPDTLGKLLGPERFAQYRDMLGPDGLMDPAEIAETYYHIAQQHRSAWTFETDLRPFSGKPWWND